MDSFRGRISVVVAMSLVAGCSFLPSMSPIVGVQKHGPAVVGSDQVSKPKLLALAEGLQRLQKHPRRLLSASEPAALNPDELKSFFETLPEDIRTAENRALLWESIDWALSHPRSFDYIRTLTLPSVETPSDLDRFLMQIGEEMPNEISVSDEKFFAEQEALWLEIAERSTKVSRKGDPHPELGNDDQNGHRAGSAPSHGAPFSAAYHGKPSGTKHSYQLQQASCDYTFRGGVPNVYTPGNHSDRFKGEEYLNFYLQNEGVIEGVHRQREASSLLRFSVPWVNQVKGNRCSIAVWSFVESSILGKSSKQAANRYEDLFNRYFNESKLGDIRYSFGVVPKDLEGWMRSEGNSITTNRATLYNPKLQPVNFLTQMIIERRRPIVLLDAGSCWDSSAHWASAVAFDKDTVLLNDSLEYEAASDVRTFFMSRADFIRAWSGHNTSRRVRALGWTLFSTGYSTFFANPFLAMSFFELAFHAWDIASSCEYALIDPTSSNIAAYNGEVFLAQGRGLLPVSTYPTDRALPDPFPAYRYPSAQGLWLSTTTDFTGESTFLPDGRPDGNIALTLTLPEKAPISKIEVLGPNGRWSTSGPTPSSQVRSLVVVPKFSPTPANAEAVKPPNILHFAKKGVNQFNLYFSDSQDSAFFKPGNKFVALVYLANGELGDPNGGGIIPTQYMVVPFGNNPPAKQSFIVPTYEKEQGDYFTGNSRFAPDGRAEGRISFDITVKEDAMLRAVRVHYFDFDPRFHQAWRTDPGEGYNPATGFDLGYGGIALLDEMGTLINNGYVTELTKLSGTRHLSFNAPGFPYVLNYLKSGGKIRVSAEVEYGRNSGYSLMSNSIEPYAGRTETLFADLIVPPQYLPTPAPTPSPTPTPPPALNPSNLLSTVHGLSADRQGNVYLIGWDADWVGSATSLSHTGRLVKISHNLSRPPEVFFDAMINPSGAYGREVTYDGEMVGDHFFIRHEGGSLLNFDLLGGTYQTQPAQTTLQNLAYREGSGDLWSGDFWSASWPGSWLIVASTDSWTTRLAYNNNDPAFPVGDYRPLLRSFLFDSQGQPLWACAKGIARFDKAFTGSEYLGNSSPLLLLSFEDAVGLVRADDVSPRHFLVSRANDTRIYLWNQDGSNFDPNQSAVADCAPYYPIRLERDKSGHYYALAFKTSNFSGSKEYQVIKYRFENGRLKKELLMVDAP